MIKCIVTSNYEKFEEAIHKAQVDGGVILPASFSISRNDHEYCGGVSYGVLVEYPTKPEFPSENIHPYYR